jgi:hypothetical protein
MGWANESTQEMFTVTKTGRGQDSRRALAPIKKSFKKVTMGSKYSRNDDKKYKNNYNIWKAATLKKKDG